MDRRDVLILDALKKHPGEGLTTLWWHDLYREGEGDMGPRKRGRFNYGYCERALTRLRKEGVIERFGKGWRVL